MTLPRSQINDRRGADRYPIKTSVLLALPNGHVANARTLDLGKDGAGIVCDLNLQVGTPVSVRLNLPATSNASVPFEASGSVVNCTLAGSDGGFRVSLQFGPLSAAAQEALKGLKP